LEPTDLDLVASRPSSIGKRASFALALLIAFCSGVAATLAWQSYSRAPRKMIANSSPPPSWSAPHAAPEASTRAIEAGSYVVQLSAGKIEPEAHAAFRTMQTKYPMLRGHQPLIAPKYQSAADLLYAAHPFPHHLHTHAYHLR